MGCLSVIVAEVEVERIGRASLRVGLVCSVGHLDPTEGIIWASDGRLITLYGGFLIAADE